MEVLARQTPPGSEGRTIVAAVWSFAAAEIRRIALPGLLSCARQRDRSALILVKSRPAPSFQLSTISACVNAVSRARSASANGSPLHGHACSCLLSGSRIMFQRSTPVDARVV